MITSAADNRLCLSLIHSFFPNANGLILNNVSVQNVQGNYYNGVDSDWIELSSMAYASNAGYNATKQCLPGTRTDILDDLEGWALGKKPQLPRTTWLSGPAGTGKSCIANTIAHRLKQIGSLGSFVAFDNSYISEKRHEKVFSTIARDLAARNEAFKKALAEALRKEGWLRSTDIVQQWENLVVQPAVHLQNEGPIVIVIEALDESGDPDSRSHLLSILGSRLEELPPNIRILLTSRPLDDISEALERSSTTLCKYMNDIPRLDAEQDIRMYISAQLARVGGSFFDSSRIRVLVNLAEGLFQWAFVACQFIKGTGGKISNPKRQYNMLITSSGTIGLTKLDSLYETVLRSVVDDSSIDLFRSVLAQVLGVFEPLSIDSLVELRNHFSLSDSDSDGDDISLVLKHMGSLLSGTSNSSIPIRPLHSSFLDYLSDERRSKDFYIDKSIHGRDLALASLEIMKDGLCFNICQLETSYLLNSKVLDLQDRVHKHISPTLSYACRYWARHVHTTTFDQQVSGAVRYILDNKFLYWVEVLSLLQCVTVASRGMSFLIKWAQDHIEGGDIAEFSSDGQRFIRMFGGAIAQSTPHLYLSALPFAPEDSIVRQKYAHQFPGALRVASGLMSNWPAFQNVLHGHQGSVYCAVLSPDDTLIVSGSYDSTVRIWDAETGETALGPLVGHTDIVNSVSFSPNGKLIVSASSDCTVRIYDVLTGRPIREPLVHSDSVTCVAFHTDNRRVISGSEKSFIRIWDMETGKEVCDALIAHAGKVCRIAVSPDGKHFVSCSEDGTIRTWKTGPYEDSGILFEGHSTEVTCVNYSMDGKRIVSGSSDETIRVWDAKTGLQVVPTINHFYPLAVAFSADGTRIISNTFEHEICIYNIQTGQITVGETVSTGHTTSENICDIAFSRDGKRVISCFDDGTIRIWDMDIPKRVKQRKRRIKGIAVSPDGRRIASAAARALNPINIWDMEQSNTNMPLHTFHGHTNDAALNIAYSPDGEYLASCSIDGTLHIWNAGTGHDLFGALAGLVSFVAFSYDNRYLFSLSTYPLGLDTLRVWDTQTGSAVGSPIPCKAAKIAVSSNSYQVASDFQIGTNEIHIFDAVDDAQSRVVFQEHNDTSTCIAFSPDGKHLISASKLDFTIKIWDIEKGIIIKKLSRKVGDLVFFDHPDCVAVSPDGRFVIASLVDNSIQLWDIKNGSIPVQNLFGHTTPVRNVTFSPDGKYIITSEDLAIRVWEMQAEEYNFLDKHDYFVQFSTKAEHALKDANLLFAGFDFDSMYWKNAIEVEPSTGWIIGPQDRRLAWVPYDYFPGLITHRTTKIFGAEITELDLSSFAHGPLWTTCFRDQED